MSKKDQNNGEGKKSDWAKAAPLIASGSQFGITCFVGAWLGKWLDGKYDTSPVWLLIMAFLFASVGFWNFIRVINKVNKEYE